MDRRSFLGASAGLLGATAGIAAGQVPRARRIGYVANGYAATASSQSAALVRGLTALGWRDGADFVVERRFADGRPERLPALLAELQSGKVDVLVVSGPDAIRATLRSASATPVVFVLLVDPVAMGFVESLARPGGKVTGVASQFEEIIAKQLQLLAEAVPGLARVGVLRRTDSTPSVAAAVEKAARALDLVTIALPVRDASDFEEAFRRARRERAGAVHVLPSPFVGAQRARVIELAARYRLPACYELKAYVRDGGLMSYGPSLDDMYTRAASYVDRILKGANPGELAVERPAQFELAINGRTAADLGLAIPASLLQRADEIIR